MDWYWDGHERTFDLIASCGGKTAGSVNIGVHGPGLIVIRRLYVKPRWRRRHIAWRLMSEISGIFPQAEKWLYAEPFRKFAWQRRGASLGDLERFYASLGYAEALDIRGRRAMVLPAG